jgi:hypothetical protein
MPVIIHYNQPPIPPLETLQAISPSKVLDDLLLEQILIEIKKMNEHEVHLPVPLIKPSEVEGAELICLNLPNGRGKRKVSIDTLRKFSQVYVSIPDGKLFQSTVNGFGQMELNDDFQLTP